MTAQQYPEHILKQADEMTWKAAAATSEQEHTLPTIQRNAEIIRDTLNLPALLMAQEQLTQHQQVVKQLAVALYKQLPISEKLSEVKWDAIKSYEALSTAKQLLEKKV